MNSPKKTAEFQKPETLRYFALKTKFVAFMNGGSVTYLGQGQIFNPK